MRIALLSLSLVCLLSAPMAWAGSPHFISCSQSVTDSTLTVDGALHRKSLLHKNEGFCTKSWGILL